MINCLVELYGIDLACSYQQMFVYIRQLAIHLRNAIQAHQSSKVALSYLRFFNF